jgi:hypothetical protein
MARVVALHCAWKKNGQLCTPAPCGSLCAWRQAMTDKPADENEADPEPASPADLFPDPAPGRDPGKAVEDEGAPPGGGNFA